MKNCFTVMLACTADGGKLPPFIIFKRNADHAERRFPTWSYVRNYEKGWMDETLTLDWIKSVWRK